MAVQIIIGRSGSGKTQYCFDALHKHIEQGKKALFIVPDQATYTMERRFAEYMPKQGYMGVQVLGFSRLAYWILQERGKTQVSISDLGKKIALQRILREKKASFSVLRKAALQPNFADTARQFIEECRSFCIEPTHLQQAANHVAEPLLQHKLQDMALIYECYLQFLQAHLGSTDDLLSAAIREIKGIPFLRDIWVGVDGFQWFTPKQIEVLMALEAVASDIWITLPMEPEQMAWQHRETALFHRSYVDYRNMQKKFPHAETVVLSPINKKALSELVYSFFQAKPRNQIKTIPGLSVWECTSKETEIASIAGEIQSLCRKGYRYKDFLIVVRSSEMYNEMVERIFATYGVPVFSDYQRPMTSHPIVETVLSLLSVLQSAWAYEPLFQLLKSDLFPIAREQVDQLENYCLAYGIQGYHWLEEKDWSYGRAIVGIDGMKTKGIADETLQEINLIRQDIRQRLWPCWQASRTSHTLQEWCTLLYQWLQQLEVPQTLQKWQEEEQTCGHAMEAKEHEQVWKKWMSFLHELVTLCGDDIVSLEEFLTFIKDGIETLQFSLIPPTLDHVTLTSIERGYTMQGRVVFLCGMNDGEFPKRNGEEGVFHERDRQQLEDAGLLLAPGKRIRSLQEKFLFYLGLTRAEEKIYLTYALTDTDNSALEPSLWIKQLKERGYVETYRYMDGTLQEGEEERLITGFPAALQLLPSQLQPATQGEAVSPIWWAVYDQAILLGYHDDVCRIVRGLFHQNTPVTLSPEMVRKVFAPDGVLRGSVTKFEQYRACPFAYFSRYGLQLQERQKYQFAAPDLGMLVHGALKYIGDDLLTQGKQWRDLDRTAIPDICRQATEVVAPLVRQDILMSNAYFLHIKERLIRTLIRTVEQLKAFSSTSDFNMYALEQFFGRMPNSWPSLDLSLSNGFQAAITGQIDRVDVMKRNDKFYLVVMDYKSGRKELALQSVFMGIELQLLTYMYVALLQMEGDALPAAVLYCYVRDDKQSLKHCLSEEEKADLFYKSNKMNGFFLDDGEIMKSLDISMHDYSAFLNLRLKKDGTLSNAGNQMYTEQGWAYMLSMVRRRLYETALRITDGYIDIAPLRQGISSPCVYCPYQAVCRFDTQCGNAYHVWQQESNDVVRDKIRQEGEKEDGMD